MVRSRTWQVEDRGSTIAGHRAPDHIASTLHIAEGAVKNHLANIITKLDGNDRTRAALRARELGLL